MSVSSPRLPGWYAVKTSTGYIGLVLHHGTKGINLGANKYGNVTGAQFIAPRGSSLSDLLSNSGPQVQTALMNMGASAKQMTSFIVQADTAAGKGGQGTTQLLFSDTGAPSASAGRRTVSTTPSGDISDTGTGDPFSSIANAIGSVTDFLSWISWIFSPQNLLRAVEFAFGMAIGLFGLYLVSKGGGGHSPTGAIRRIISVTPAGRTIRRAEGRRMGKREGQREAARMEARQAETRDIREQSAVERERINVSARQTARASEN